ncbi:MAG: holo-ACP synthase [Rhodocyclaceae bacterium]|nr:holo-ACP synthase [Rhodocyclaceae bacterium]MBL0076030.1 holo-ACP synthase [Rhodocyclaceae bacterium]MBP6108391.1 holo-ACP synthase [Rhodocyclaceae bacterium]MBP6278407.1 holo-ACP synthase [Rhodocyclaceae bacterium]
MIQGIGTDIVAVQRMRQMLERHGVRAMTKILTVSECDECTHAPDAAVFMAKRFAAKEALAKALGRGLRAPLLMPAITVKHHEFGQPYFELDASAAHLLDAQTAVHLSISDEQDFAVAFVILEKS